MTARASTLGLAAGLTLTASSLGFAAAPTAQDIAPAGVVGPAGITILDTEKPAVAAAKEHQPRGNPLWAVPLSVLSATRERPIFLPSRRPPAPVIANTRSETPKPSAVPPPERPRFALVGAVTGENEAIAVFLDQATNGVIRLRMGQDHDGWVLSSVKGRTATLQKDQKTFVLNLPVPGVPPGPVAAAGIAAAPSAPADGAIPARALGNGMVFPDPSLGAPYIPRSTPKNGEPDGL